MAEPIVYVGKYKILNGKLESFKQFEKELAEFIEANEPQIIAHITYIDDDGTEATRIQIHPSSRSMETHLEIVGPRIAQAMEFIGDVGIELYGTPTDSLRERMTQMAQMSGVSLKFIESHAGFSRLRAD